MVLLHMNFQVNRDDDIYNVKKCPRGAELTGDMSPASIISATGFFVWILSYRINWVMMTQDFGK
jgi:hypothetical protein